MNYYFQKCSEENFVLCVKYMFWGQERNVLQKWMIGDRLILRTEKGIAGLFEVTTRSFSGSHQIWIDKQYPHRIGIKPIKILHPKKRIPITAYNLRNELRTCHGNSWGWKLDIAVNPLKQYLAKKIEKIIENQPSFELAEDIIIDQTAINKDIESLYSNESENMDEVKTNSIKKGVVERCSLLGLTDLHEIALFAVLANKPEMIGSAEKVIREAVPLIDPAQKETTNIKMEETAKNLVFWDLFKYNAKRNLYFINKRFWNRNIIQIKLENLAIYEVLYERQGMSFYKDVFLAQVLKYLKTKYNLESPLDSVFLHVVALSRKNELDAIVLTEFGSDEEKNYKISWNGNYDELSRKIENLSKEISGIVIDDYQDIDELEKDAKGFVEDDTVIHKDLTDSGNIEIPSEYGEIEESAEEPYGQTEIHRSTDFLGEKNSDKANASEEQTAADPLNDKLPFIPPDLPEPVDPEYSKVPSDTGTSNQNFDHDDETKSLLGILTGKGDESTQSSEEQGDEIQTQEKPVDVLEYLQSKFENNPHFQAKSFFNKLEITVKPDSNPFILSIEYQPEFNRILIKTFFEIVKGTVLNLLDLSGKDDFMSTIGTTIRNGNRSFVVRRSLSISKMQHVRLFDLVMQCIAEMAKVNEIIQRHKPSNNI